MTWSCAVLLILGVLTLGARGDEDTINSLAVDEDVNSTSSQPLSVPVWLILLNLPSNDTLGNWTTPGESLGNSSDSPGPRAVLLITTPVESAANGTEDGSNTTTLMGNPVKRMTEEPDPGAGITRLAISEARLARRKRTLSKHHGCKICGLINKMMTQSCDTCHPPPMYHPPPPPVYYPPQRQQYCDPCQRQQQHKQHYQPPPAPQQHYQPQPQPQNHDPCGGGCGGGGGRGSWSHSYSSSSSSSGTYGKKK